MDTVHKTLPAAAANNQLRIIVDTPTKNLQNVYREHVSIEKIKNAVHALKALGNPYYADVKVAEPDDLQDIIVADTDGALFVAHARCN